MTPRPSFAGLDDDRLVRAVERFLYAEADLLDQWRLHEWLELFGPDSHYLVPSTDRPHGQPDRDLFLVQDDRFLLEQRVNSLLTRSAHAEYPHSRTRRMVTNVAAHDRPDGDIDAVANFVVFRMRPSVMDTYVGRYHHVLRPDPELGFHFRTRKAVLDLTSLRPLGKISIIL